MRRIQHHIATVFAGSLLFLAGAAQATEPNAGKGDTPSAIMGDKTLSADAKQLGPENVDPQELARDIGLDIGTATERSGVMGKSRDGEETRKAPAAPAASKDGEAAADTMSAPDAPEADRAVFGKDTRERVKNTQNYPFRTIGIIQMSDSAGNNFMCTGTLISPKTVVTTAHCLYNVQQGAWYDNFLFAPGADGYDNLPFGAFEWAHVYIMEGYASQWNGDYRAVMPYDLGVIILDRDIGTDLGWLGFEYDPQARPYIVNHIGFPLDKKPAGTMWQSACEIAANQIYDYAITHHCPSSQGSNGGPLYVYDSNNDSRFIRGLELFPNEQANIGSRFTELHYNWLVQNLQ